MAMNSDFGNEDIFEHVLVTKKLIHDGCPSIDLFNIDYFRYSRWNLYTNIFVFFEKGVVNIAFVELKLLQQS